jgi:L-alanine-DL-glutamate epimerase-like enolase superfamily enzyme
MASITYAVYNLKKRVPLTISRGTRTHGQILWLKWNEEGVEGWGEAVPFSYDANPHTLESIIASLEANREWLESASAWDRLEVEKRLQTENASTALAAAINLAMYDWLGKRTKEPVWRLLGMRASHAPLTSVTIGISPPGQAIKRVAQWLEAGELRAFKVKLGSPAGAGADQAMLEAVLSVVPQGARISVDANGGWTPEVALTMAGWLADRGIDHLEQPLPRGQEAHLPALHAASPLPIIVDESCRNSQELAKIAGCVSGINIKLMKCGGLDGGLRLVHTARAHGLKVLVGCYGNSALGNTAAAVLGPIVDYLDLDSHLNLEADPFSGVVLEDGTLRLPDLPGFGVTHE